MFVVVKHIVKLGCRLKRFSGITGCRNGAGAEEFGLSERDWALHQSCGYDYIINNQQVFEG